MLPFERHRDTLLVVDLQVGLRRADLGPAQQPRPWNDGRPSCCARGAGLDARSCTWRHMSTEEPSPLRPGQPGNEFKPGSAPVAGETVIEKRVNSAFIGTSSRLDLRRAGCRGLVIVGLTTNHCVSTTARMAGNLGFATWAVSDATATFDRVGPDGVKHLAEHIHAIALSDLHGEFATVVDTSR